MNKPNIAILGATGVVGREITKIVEELGIEFNSIKFLSSARSAGSKLVFMGKEYVVEEATPDSFNGVDIVIEPLSSLAFARMVYGFIMIAVIGYTVDLVQSGNQQSNQIMIFCKDYEAMAEMINTKAHRGATLIDAMGWYTKTPSKAVMVVCRKRDTSMILKLIREQDPNAFLTVGSVMGVYGQGFDALNKA